MAHNIRAAISTDRLPSGIRDAARTVIRALPVLPVVKPVILGMAPRFDGEIIWYPLV
jgi:hypothetical protein